MTQQQQPQEGPELRIAHPAPEEPQAEAVESAAEPQDGESATATANETIQAPTPPRAPPLPILEVRVGGKNGLCLRKQGAVMRIISSAPGVWVAFNWHGKVHATLAANGNPVLVLFEDQAP